MKLRKILILSVLTIFTVVLAGCSEKLSELTPGERDAIVSYSAHLVTKYNINQKKGFVYLDEETIQKMKTNQQSNTPVTPTIPTDSEDDNQNGNQTGAANKTVTAKEAMGLSGINATVTGMDLADSFTGENGAFNITPSEGNKLLWINVQLTNETNAPIMVDVLSSTMRFFIRVNGKVESSSMVTILHEDLSTLQKELAAGEKLDTMLFFQVSEQKKEALTTVDFVVNKDKTNYVVNVK